jgi:hypothetical protein
MFQNTLRLLTTILVLISLCSNSFAKVIEKHAPERRVIKKVTNPARRVLLPPKFTSTPDTQATEGHVYIYTPTVTKIDEGRRPIFKAEKLPVWLTLDPATGRLTGTPTNDDVGAHTVTLTVTDGVAPLGKQHFMLTVQNINNEPQFTSHPERTALEDARYHYVPRAKDIDARTTLIFKAPTLPHWLDFNEATHLLSGVPTNDDVGEHPVVITVSDGESTVQHAFSITVNNTNDPPVWTSLPITNTKAGAIYVYTAEAEELDLGATLTFGAYQLPGWLSFNPGTKLLSGIPGEKETGSHRVHLWVSDGISPLVEQVFMITVTGHNALDGSILKVQSDSHNIELLVFTPDLEADNYAVIELINGQQVRRIPAENLVRKPVHDTNLQLFSFLLRDLSSSLDDHAISETNTAMSAYFARMSDDSRVGLIDFSSNVIVRHRPTNDRRSLQNALHQIGERGSTALFDAIVKAIDELVREKTKGLKFVVVFTDGADSGGGHSLFDVVNLAKTHQIPIVCVGMGNAEVSTLESIARETHGLYLHAPKADDLLQIYNRIADFLDSMSIITYPTPARSGDDVSVSVEHSGGRRTVARQFTIK